MTRPIADLDVPLPRLQQQLRALVARQREQRAEASAERLQTVLAPADIQPETTPEEATK